MKLESKYLYMAYIGAMINQVKHNLEKDGFIDITSPQGFFDLLVEKNGVKRAYEFKISSTNHNFRKKKSIEMFIEKANEIGAEPIVIYINKPDRISVEFDDFGEILYDYFIDNFPQELDILSTHTRLDNVLTEQIKNIIMEKDKIKISADALAELTLCYGSDRERDEDDEMSISVPVEVYAELDWNKNILDISCKFDLSEFYGD